MAHPLASIWESHQTKFLAESADPITIYYRPVRSGTSVAFDSFYQEGTDPANPTFLDEPVLKFDGNDWYDLPVLSYAQVNDDWIIEFDTYIPLLVNNSPYYSMFSFGNIQSGAEAAIYLNFFRAGNTFTYCSMLMYTDQGSGGYTISGYMYDDVWIHVKLEKSGLNLVATITGEKVPGTGESIFIDTIPDGETFTFDTVNMGCFISHFFNGSANPFFLLKSDTKMKFMSGGFFKFGTPYIDIAKTTVAQQNDNVAALVNLGYLNGDIVQGTSSAQAILSSDPIDSTSPDPVTVAGKTHLDMYGAAIGSGEGDQQLQIGKFPESDALFTCLLSDVQTSTNPDPILTVFDNDIDTVKYIVVDKDKKRYDVEAIKMRGMGAVPFLVDVFLKLTNKEI